MDPGVKLGLLLAAVGVAGGGVYFVVRKLFGPPPPRDPSASNDKYGGLPPGS